MTLHRTTWISSNTTVCPGEGELTLSLHRRETLSFGASIISLILGTDCMLVPPVVGGNIHSKTSDYDCFLELCRETTNVVFNQCSTCSPARFFSLRAVSGIKFTAVFTRKWIRVMWCHGFGTAVV